MALSQHNAPLGSIALKASAGAAEVLPIIYVPQPPTFIDISKRNGWKFYAAALPTEKPSGNQQCFSTTNLDLPLLVGPCVLMLGNEGSGLSQMLQRRANYLLNIVGDRSRIGSIDSLNVGVAAALLCEAFRPSVIHQVKKDLF